MTHTNNTKPSIQEVNEARLAWGEAFHHFRYGSFVSEEEYESAKQAEEHAFDRYYNLHIDYYQK